ncbi:hypothetical protein GCM10023116_03900 [Kistimonas scapharcae]|uniref:NrS-1 polymerase-like helicase domain-containing protein n=1 Tax=Kistimonas scapharcae TaxID=1036133 RepID=A0ABP8UYV6_9GAMM
MLKDKITFITDATGKRLAKHFCADGSKTDYPNSWKINSVEKEVTLDAEGLRKKYRLLQLFASKGHAMYKGHFTRPLEGESRKGLTDTNRTTQTIILDFDKIELPGVIIPDVCTESTVIDVAERLVAILPECFRGVSYIATASSSFGMKGNKISMHLEFWLQEAINPRQLKEFLLHLNLTQETLVERLKLSGNKRTLSYPLDICLADNSRIVYLAPPTFEKPGQNPFANDDHRITLIEKKESCVNLTIPLLDVDAEKNRAAQTSQIKKIHKKLGMPYKQPNYKKLSLQSGNTQVISNPGAGVMTLYADHGDYCSFNLDGGDSHAYLVNKNEPGVVRNLKGEDYFLFEECDPDTFKWFTEEYLAEKKPEDGSNTNPLRPIAFIERSEDEVWYGMYDHEKNELVDMYKTTMIHALDGWFESRGAVKPERLGYMTRHFDPHSDEKLNLKKEFINTFEPADYFFNPVNIKKEFKGVSLDNADALKGLCPTVYDLIRHVTNGYEETKLFINWLAAIFQRRDKLGLAWVIHGVQGTGKGNLINQVLIPILGNAAFEGTGSMLDEEFNNFLENKLIIFFDEFKLGDSKNVGKQYSKIKGLITEPMTPIRSMRKNWDTKKTHCNFIFASNEKGAVRISSSDRRFNVCPRQEIKIATQYPDWPKRVEKDLPKELPAFSCFLQEFDVDWYKATTPTENEAKEIMRVESRTSQEEFAEAIKTGNLEFFIDVLNVNTPDGSANMAKTAVKTWIRDSADGVLVASTAQLREVYSVLISRQDHTAKFGKLLSHVGITPTTHKVNRKTVRGVKVEWKMDDIRRKELMDTYQIKLATDFLPSAPREDFCAPKQKKN